MLLGKVVALTAPLTPLFSPSLSLFIVAMSSPSPDLEEHNIEDVVGGYYLFFQTLAELRDHIDTAPDIGDNSEKLLNTFLDQLESMFNVCWLFVCVCVSDCCCELSCCSSFYSSPSFTFLPFLVSVAIC